MSVHVAPHRWADAFAGKLAEREVAAMELHAETCARCARSRDRVNRASQSFPALRAQSAPELGWDGVRARVHWQVSSEKRAKQRAARPRLVPALAVGTFATSVVVLALATESPTSRAPEPQPIAAPTPVRPPPKPLAALVVRELGDQVMINGLVRRRIFDEVLAAGTVIATGRGSLDVQFDTDSALALGPNSMLTFARFDSERVELVLAEGTLDVTVSRRAPEQRFVIQAGARTIEVRGTQFRVRHDETNTTHVACAHGKIAVRDADGELEVTSAERLELAPAAKVATSRPSALSSAEHDELARATPRTLPVWTDASQLVQTSAALEVATIGTRDVRVDGLEVGQGPLRVRVMPGRHTVETADNAGRFRRAGWVDVAAGKPARLDVHEEPGKAATGGVASRRKQLHAGIDRARLAQCTRAIAKAGVTDTYVRIEISIDETGAVGFLNVIDTDLPSTTASCVRGVLADVRFKSGAAATFRDKLDL